MKIGEKKDTVKKTYENMQCIIFEICNFFKNLDQEISKNTNIKRFGQTNILAQTNSNSYNNPDDMIRKFFGMIWVNKKNMLVVFWNSMTEIGK